MFNNENNHHRLGVPHGSWWWQDYLFWRWQPRNRVSWLHAVPESWVTSAYLTTPQHLQVPMQFLSIYWSIKGNRANCLMWSPNRAGKESCPTSMQEGIWNGCIHRCSCPLLFGLCTVCRGCEHPLSNQPSKGQLGRFSPIIKDHPGLPPSRISETTWSRYNLILNNYWEDLYGPLSNIEHLVRVLSVPLSDLNGLNRKLQECCKHHKAVPPTLCCSPFFLGGGGGLN